MPYFIIGVVVLIIGIIFLRLAIKNKDKEGIVGLSALLIGSMILILFFGLFFGSQI